MLEVGNGLAWLVLRAAYLNMYMYFHAGCSIRIDVVLQPDILETDALCTQPQGTQEQ